MLLEPTRQCTGTHSGDRSKTSELAKVVGAVAFLTAGLTPRHSFLSSHSPLRRWWDRNMARERLLTRLVEGGERSSLFAWPRYVISATPCFSILYMQLTFEKLVEERVPCGKLGLVDIRHRANASSSALTTQADCFVGDSKESILPVSDP